MLMRLAYLYDSSNGFVNQDTIKVKEFCQNSDSRQSTAQYHDQAGTQASIPQLAFASSRIGHGTAIN